MQPSDAKNNVIRAVLDVDRTLMDRQIALLKDKSLTGHDAELVHKFLHAGFQLGQEGP